MADHWLTVKKLMIESTLADKLKLLAGAERDIPLTMINLMESHFTSLNEWDVTSAGKVLPVAETVCRWITSVEKYFTKEQVFHSSPGVIMNEQRRDNTILAENQAHLGGAGKEGGDLERKRV